MKMRFLIVGLALMSGLAFGQPIKVSRGSGNTENLNKVRPGMAIKPQDSMFFVQAMRTNVAEVKVGELAMKRGGSQWSRQYGKMLMMDHAQAFEEIKQIGRRLKLPVSKQVPPDAQALIARLKRLHGAAFDNAFRSAMIDGHEKFTTQIEREIKFGNNSLIRNYAITLGPVVRQHLKMAQRGVTKL